MNFFKQLSPSYSPPVICSQGELQVLRDRFLQSILLVFSILGLALIYMTILAVDQQNVMWLGIGYIGLYVSALVLTVFRTIPFSIRAHVTAILIYMMSLMDMFENGDLSGIRMLLLVFVTVTAVLFNYKKAIGAVVVGLVTIVTIGVLGTINQEFSSSLGIQRIGLDWINSSLIFLIFAAILASGINNIISSLETNLKNQAVLAQNMQHERDMLDNRIQERTRTVARRMDRMRTVGEISRSLTALGDPDNMLNSAVAQVQEKFELYYVGVFLVDETGQNAVLSAGTGDAGRKMLADGHRLTIGGSSMIGWCISNREPRIALDVGSDAVRFSNPNLPLTRSEMAIPITAGDRVLGAMTIQSSQPNAFDEYDVILLKSLVDNMALILQNDRIYLSTRQSLEEIRALNRDHLQRAWAETIENYGELAYTFDNPGANNAEQQNQVLQVPLMLRDEVIGHILLETEKSKLSAEEESFVESITNQTAIALENARLLQQTERRAVQEQKLNELTARFSRAMSIDEILRAAAQELGQLPMVAEVGVRLAPVEAAKETLHSTGDTAHYGGGNGHSNGKEHSA